MGSRGAVFLHPRHLRNAQPRRRLLQLAAQAVRHRRPVAALPHAVVGAPEGIVQDDYAASTQLQSCVLAA